MYLHLFPRDALLPASNFAQYKVVAGTNFPVESLAYDGGSADEAAYFVFKIRGYTSGNITVRIGWYADTASSGNVVWGASLAAITPDADTQDIETKSFATEVTQQDSHLGTTGQRLHECVLTLNQLDSVADGDLCVVRLQRKASDTTNDTMTGDALLTHVELEAA